MILRVEELGTNLLNGRHHLTLVGLEVLQSSARTRKVKVDIMIVFRQLPQHRVDVGKPEKAPATDSTRP